MQFRRLSNGIFGFSSLVILHHNELNLSMIFICRSNTTLKWRLIGDIPKFGRAKTRAIIQEAFNDWARYAPLKFCESPDDESAEFVIDFVTGDHRDGYPFDGPAGTLAHAFFPKDGRIHFDATEDWSEKSVLSICIIDLFDGITFIRYTSDGGFNFRLVASHEIGHALGLAHSLDSKALMYPFYQLFQPEELLPKDVFTFEYQFQRMIFV
jgi:Matrixin